MSKYQDWLIEYIKTHPEFIQPKSRKNEVLGFLKNKLGDLCISRPKLRLKWGIELPFDSNYVTYVWFDALLNYITAIGYKQDEERFNKWWPANYHLIGKDIVTTHCVYWPTMMRAIGIPMPKTIFAHGWWMVDETKMSKSLKNIVKPLDLIDSYGVDPVRYFLIRDMTLGQDSNFSEDFFIKRYNSELANDFGNLVSRIVTLIRKNFNSVVPKILINGKEELKIIDNAKTLPEKVNNLIDNLHLNDAVETIIIFIRSINKYMELLQPWHLVKQDKQEAGTVLYTAAEGLRIAALLLHPIMPAKISTLLKAFPTADNRKNSFEWGTLKSGEKLGELPILFPRIIKKIEIMKEVENKGEELISIDDFSKVKLITAKVLAAERIPKTDKLLKLSIDTGEEKRQIIAGIAQYYNPEVLIGKTVIIVANLQPVKIRGIESQGMLLTAEKGENLTLLTTFDDLGPGSFIS